MERSPGCAQTATNRLLDKGSVPDEEDSNEVPLKCRLGPVTVCRFYLESVSNGRTGLADDLGYFDATVLADMASARHAINTAETILDISSRPPPNGRELSGSDALGLPSPLLGRVIAHSSHTFQQRSESAPASR